MVSIRVEYSLNPPVVSTLTTDQVEAEEYLVAYLHSPLTLLRPSVRRILNCDYCDLASFLHVEI